MNSKTAIARWIDSQVSGDHARYDSVRDMAERSGIPATTLNRLHHGQPPSQKNLEKLARAASLNLSDFIRVLEELEQDGSMRSYLADQIRKDAADLPLEDQEIVFNLIQSLRAKRMAKTAKS